MTPRLAYAVCMVLAAGVFILARRCFPGGSGWSQLRRDERWTLTLAAFVGGMIGAKLPFVLSAAESFFSMAWLADGKTVTTGLMGAYLSVELVKYLLGIKVKTGDSFALPLALALAVGRFGCFLNGCCHGVPMSLPWGYDFGDGVRRHPTQLYEVLFHLLMAGTLIVIIRRGWLVNQRLKFYLICYGLYRFATEFIRPEPVVAVGLTWYQWGCTVMVVGLLIQWWIDQKHEGQRTQRQ